jgi:hypothetical protein
MEGEMYVSSVHCERGFNCGWGDVHRRADGFGREEISPEH